MIATMITDHKVQRHLFFFIAIFILLICKILNVHSKLPVEPIQKVQINVGDVRGS